MGPNFSRERADFSLAISGKYFERSNMNKDHVELVGRLERDVDWLE